MPYTGRLVASTALALALLVLPAAAAAQTAADSGDAGPRVTAGPYLSVTGFLVGLTDADFRDESISSIDGTLSSETGWGAAAAVGFGTTAGVRLELEGSWRQNDFDELRGAGIPVPIDGDVDALALMGNVVFEPVLAFPVRPYIGAGLGGARLAIDAEDTSDNDTVFAYQGMVGVSVGIGGRGALFGGYRYFATDDPEFGDVTTEYRSHNLEIGVRFGF
jgi:opacity protein-like surface antigen